MGLKYVGVVQVLAWREDRGANGGDGYMVQYPGCDPVWTPADEFRLRFRSIERDVRADEIDEALCVLFEE